MERWKPIVAAPGVCEGWAAGETIGEGFGLAIGVVDAERDTVLHVAVGEVGEEDEVWNLLSEVLPAGIQILGVMVRPTDEAVVAWARRGGRRVLRLSDIPVDAEWDPALVPVRASLRIAQVLVDGRREPRYSPEPLVVLDRSKFSFALPRTGLVVHGSDHPANQIQLADLDGFMKTSRSQQHSVRVSASRKSKKSVAHQRRTAEDDDSRRHERELDPRKATADDPLEVVLLENGPNPGRVQPAPMLSGSQLSNCSSSLVNLDVMVYARLDQNLAEVRNAIVEALQRQTSGVLPHRSGEILVPFHFLPPGLPFVITLVLPQDADESSALLLKRRKRLHSCLRLPMNRPLFLRSCALHRQIESPSYTPRLRNVHDGLQVVGRGSIHLVQGLYDYFHYMQDRFDDNGWGCAYRSLQTLISWCVLQKYATCSVPNHQEIQETLVEIGDKPKRFAGSKEWIGANEVCYALEHFTGISSRIMHVSAGSEIALKGRELAYHFDTQGSPVMIGGGVLAYTILGVQFDSVTGDTHFLILDPHYIGPEDVSVIQSKGWCGWKKPSLFVAHAFYNLCMPIRPRVFI